MLNFGEICFRVAQNIQIGATEAYVTETVPRQVQLAYQEIHDMEVWSETVMDPFVFVLPANTDTFILPKKYAAILRCYNDDFGRPMRLLDSSSFADQAFISNRQFTRTYALDSLSQRAPSPVLTPLTSAQQVKLASSDNADLSVMFIRGVSSIGEQTSESITLTGITNVTSVNSYASIDAWSKTKVPSAGVESLKDNAGNVIATLGRWETTSTYRRYQVNGTSPADVNLRLVCKKAFVPFQNNYDYPFTNMDVCIVHRATAIAWREHRQLELAAQEEQLFQESLNKLRSRELNTEDVILFAPAMRC